MLLAFLKLLRSDDSLLPSTHLIARVRACEREAWLQLVESACMKDRRKKKKKKVKKKVGENDTKTKKTQNPMLPLALAGRGGGAPAGGSRGNTVRVISWCSR